MYMLRYMCLIIRVQFECNIFIQLSNITFDEYIFSLNLYRQ